MFTLKAQESVKVDGDKHDDDDDFQTDEEEEMEVDSKVVQKRKKVNGIGIWINICVLWLTFYSSVLFFLDRD